MDAGNKKKYVYLGEMTKENILGFLNNYSENEYGLSDEVKYEDDGAPTEEELWFNPSIIIYQYMKVILKIDRWKRGSS